MKVLIVEDSQLLRDRAVEELAGIVGKAAIIQAGSVNEARSQLLEHRPEIVILDLLLPDGYGLELFTTLREIRLPAQVVVMTSEPSEYLKRKALQLGARCFFDKMKDFDQVFISISEIVARIPADYSTTARS